MDAAYTVVLVIVVLAIAVGLLLVLRKLLARSR